MEQITLFGLGPALADGSGGMRSKARTVLLGLLALPEHSRETIARRVRCTPEFVSICACGKQKPQRWRLRVAFERQYGIMADWWDLPDDAEECVDVTNHC